MKFTIVTTVLLGLLLTPALADTNLNTGDQQSSGNKQYINEQSVNNKMPRKQISIDGGFQTLSVHVENHVATIEEDSTHGLWKTIWNYDTGLIASKVLPERVCYISKVNRMDLPRFDDLSRLVEESMNLESQSQPAREVTFVIERRIHNLRPYGQDIFTLCRGIPTYLAYKVNGRQHPHNQGSCVTLDVLQLLGLQYCRQLGQNMKQDLVSN